jgi:predicted PurR-regulated permease PerM
MSHEATEKTTTLSVADPIAQRAEHSRQAWRRLGMRVRGITPAELARVALLAVAVIVLFALTRQAWSALVPFLVAGAIAYILLPLVNRLDRVMPRVLAILIVMIGFVALIFLFGASLVVLVAEQVQRLAQLLPTAEQLQQFDEQVAQAISGLPEPTQFRLREMIQQAGNSWREGLATQITDFLSFGSSGLLSLLSTVGFVLGVLVIPSWLLIVLAEQKSGVRALNRVLPRWMRGDFWAVMRIVDRSFKAFLGGQLMLGVATGVLMYLGLILLERIGWSLVERKILLSMIVGLFQLIPEIGAYLAALPMLVMMFTGSPEVGLATLGLYIAAQRLANALVAPRFERRMANIHPAILIVVIVALSELGLLWVFLAAPIAGIVYDLLRYAFGRLSEPPRPAGFLPEEKVATRPAAATAPARVPLVYRRSQALGRAAQPGEVER